MSPCPRQWAVMVEMQACWVIICASESVCGALRGLEFIDSDSVIDTTYTFHYLLVLSLTQNIVQ